MSDPIVNQAAQQLAEQGAQAAETSIPETEVDPTDQAAFDQALADPQEAEAAQAQTVSEADHAEACANDKNCTLGDAILDGLEHIKTSHDAHMSRIQTQLEATGGEAMTVEDAMRLQFEVMQMGIEQDLTTKMADKTSQGVQTLFRNQ